MTIFELDILFWYRCRASDHEVVRTNPPIWPETRDWMLREHLLELNPPDKGDTCYRLGDRGHVLIDHIEALPLPEWKMP
mgnify:CR=1 FL=1